MGGAEKGVFGVELGEFPGGTRAVAMLFGEAIVLVQTMLPLDFAHGGIGSSEILPAMALWALGLEEE